VVPLTGGIGFLYEVDDTLYWAYRLSGAAVDSPWTAMTLYTGLPDSSEDPYDTHFNVAADAANNLYLAFAAHEELQYTKYLSDAGVWGAVQAMTPPTSHATYMEVVLTPANVMLITNFKSSEEVLQSNDQGNTFTVTQRLTHPAAEGAVSYQNPRVVAPSNALDPVPVWQQYVDGPTQELLFFQVPVIQ